MLLLMLLLVVMLNDDDGGDDDDDDDDDGDEQRERTGGQVGSRTLRKLQSMLSRSRDSANAACGRGFTGSECFL